MAHTHAGNAGDYLKHVVLAETLEAAVPEFQEIRFIDPFCGQGLYHWPNGLYSPDSNHPKRAIFERYQPGLPEWYEGSPLVAARALSAHSDASLILSDADPDAISTLQSIEVEHYPYWARVPKRMAVTAHQPEGVDLLMGRHALNVLLLDPTYPDGYASTLRRSYAACVRADVNALLLAWGLLAWRMDPEIAGDGTCTVTLCDEGQAYQMLAAAIGPRAVTLHTIAETVASGW